MVAWWGTVVECYSAFARLHREGVLNSHSEEDVRRLLTLLSESWTEIEPGMDIRDIAGRLLLMHPLRAADSLQLAAALLWANKSPRGHHFVCLDGRLREAARKEGFKLLPTDV